MRVEPKTDAEIETMNLREAGEYDFEVLDAEEKQSKQGNEMVELKVKLEGADGRSFTLFDYLVSTDGMAYKVKHFAKAVGLLSEYEKGDMAAEYMLGRTGRCKLAVQPAKGGYPAKNVIADYIGTGDAARVEKTPALVDDEIPF